MVDIIPNSLHRGLLPEDSKQNTAFFISKAKKSVNVLLFPKFLPIFVIVIYSRSFLRRIRHLVPETDSSSIYLCV